MSFSFAFSFPSLVFRASPAIGSVRSWVSSPSGSTRNRKASGKHSWSGDTPALPSEAFGSPSTMKAKIRSSRFKLLKYLISSLTQWELEERGEQITIRDRDCCKGRSMLISRLDDDEG